MIRSIDVRSSFVRSSVASSVARVAIVLSCLAASTARAIELDPPSPTACDSIHVLVERTFDVDCEWRVVPDVGVFASQISVRLALRGSDACLRVEADYAFEVPIGRLAPGVYDIAVSWTDSPELESARFEVAAADCGAGFLRGDANSDGAINISDAIKSVLYLFADGELACREAADIDADGALNITDAIYSVNWLFLDGPEPALPWPDCDEPPGGLRLDCSKPQCGASPPTHHLARADGCVQCDVCFELDIEEVVGELRDQGIDVVEFFYGRDEAVCEACDCPSGRNYVVEVPAADREALLAIGWRDWSPGDRGVGTPLRFSTIDRGEFSELPIGATFVRSARDQERLGIETPSPVDYTQSMLVVVAEAQNFGGHHLRIDRMVRYESEIEIFYTRSVPTDHCPTHDALVRPYHVVHAPIATGTPLILPTTVEICCGLPMRVEGKGFCRRLPLGAFWNGTGCEMLSACECIGEDCDLLFPTLETCESAYGVCPENPER